MNGASRFSSTRGPRSTPTSVAAEVKDGLAAEHLDPVDYIRLYESIGQVPGDVNDASDEIHPRSHVSRTRCAEVLSRTPAATDKPEPADLSDVGTRRSPPPVKVLLIAERVDGFFLERLTERGELVATTRHDTMDEAMDQVYSECDTISDWRLCPDDVDPLEYLRAHSDR